MRSGEILKKLGIYSPTVIPFSGIPLFGVAGFHLTVSRAYFSLIVLLYILHSFGKGSFTLISGRSGVVFWGLVVYGALLFFSVFWSDNPIRAISYIFYYFWYILFVGVFLTSSLGQKDISKFYDVWVITGFFVALMCFVEVTYEVRFPGSRYFSEKEITHQFRPTATMYNENNLAIYLAISAVLALSTFEKVGGALKAVILFTLIWVLYVILLTASRSGFLVIIVGFCLYLAFATRVSFRSLVKVVFVLVVAFLVVGYSGMLEPIIETYGQITNALAEGDARVPLFYNAFLAMQENYMMGVGAGGIESYMTQFSNVRVQNVHNWFGEVIANSGVFGGGIWLGMFCFMFMCTKGRKQENSQYWLSAYVIFLLLPVWQSIVSSMIQFAAFWLFLSAFLVQIHNRCKPNEH